MLFIPLYAAYINRNHLKTCRIKRRKTAIIIAIIIGFTKATVDRGLPSGKQTKNYGKSLKITISMGKFLTAHYFVAKNSKCQPI